MAGWWFVRLWLSRISLLQVEKDFILFFEKCSLVSILISFEIAFAIENMQQHNRLCKRRHDTQHNDTQHNDTQHNDTQYNDTQHNDTENIVLNVIYFQCR
jgi:hypothetical protein